MATRSLNKVLLIGNLTRDPELRYTPQGTAVCTLGLATNRSWTPSDGGEQKESTEFHRLVAWAKLAEICAQILYKGRKVFVEGRLQTREWTDQEGKPRSVTEIVMDNMIALGAPKGGGPAGYEEAEEGVYEQPVAAAEVAVEEAKAKKSTKAKAAKKEDGQEEKVDSEDIPF